MSAQASANSTVNSASAVSTTTAPNDKAPILVQGEGAPGVSVQSQFATHVLNEGKAYSRTNLSQVVGDLGAVHKAATGWLDAENAKIEEWGRGEIQRIVDHTKQIEHGMVADAQTKQKGLDESHKLELSKMLNKLDADKATKLKALEDELQRNIQSALNKSKDDINRVESEINNRKMKLLQQLQLQTSKDIDRMGALAVEAKLVPTQTRTVIQTNTQTGQILAVAAGGNISTGAATAQTISHPTVQAVPTAGRVTQDSNVMAGDVVRNADNSKVGTGGIGQIQTNIVEVPAQPLPGGSSTVAPTTLNNQGVRSQGNDYKGLGTMPAAPLAPNQLGSGTHDVDRLNNNTGSSDQTTLSRDLDRTRIREEPTTGVAGTKHIDAAYGVPLDKEKNMHYNKPSTYEKESHLTSDGKELAKDQKNATDRTMYDKTATDRDVPASSSGKQSEGLMDKMKHAVKGEPKTSDTATKGV